MPVSLIEQYAVGILRINGVCCQTQLNGERIYFKPFDFCSCEYARMRSSESECLRR